MLKLSEGLVQLLYTKIKQAGVRTTPTYTLLLWLKVHLCVSLPDQKQILTVPLFQLFWTFQPYW